MIPKILEAIQMLAANPRPADTRKLVGSDGEYRIRVGNYRVVYFIDDLNRIIDVQRIRHRKDAYS